MPPHGPRSPEHGPPGHGSPEHGSAGQRAERRRRGRGTRAEAGPRSPEDEETPRSGRARLTGRGTAVLALLSMGVVGAGNQLLPGSSPVRYGVLFVLVSMGSALLVRPGELVTPVLVLPIAFAGGLLFIGDPAEIVSTLALQAPWLYGGTLAAGLLALARGRVARKQARRAAADAR